MPKGERVLHDGVVNKDLYNVRCIDNFVRVARLGMLLSACQPRHSYKIVYAPGIVQILIYNTTM